MPETADQALDAAGIPLRVAERLCRDLLRPGAAGDRARLARRFGAPPPAERWEVPRRVEVGPAWRDTLGA